MRASLSIIWISGNRSGVSLSKKGQGPKGKKTDDEKLPGLRDRFTSFNAVYWCVRKEILDALFFFFKSSLHRMKSETIHHIRPDPAVDSPLFPKDD